MRNLAALGCCAALVLLACAGSDGPPESHAPLGRLSTALDSTSPGTSYINLGGSTTTTAGQGFTGFFMPEEDATFEVQFQAQPVTSTGSGPIDAVLGLSNGPASAFTDLAAIVRFAPSGFIDVRNGSSYSADAALPYQTYDQVYYFELDVNLTAHTYSVIAGQDGSPSVQLATNYPFRTEQASVARLDTIAQEVDSSSGSVVLTNVSVSSPTACQQASSGSGWGGKAFAAQSGHIQLELDAEPIGYPVDAVIGLSNGVAGAFTDLAAIARFAPSGLIDARNGAAYSSTASVPYTSGKTYHFLLDVDIPSSTYSVQVKDQGEGPYTTVASGFAFRSEQSGVPSLDDMGTYVDSASGDVVVCNLTVAY